MNGYFFIVGMQIIHKRHTGRAAHHHRGGGAYAYALSLVDEDWQPLPSTIKMDPNHMVAINDALGAGNSLSDENFVICRLAPNGSAVTISEVITDSQQILSVREHALKRRRRQRITAAHQPREAKYSGICGGCGFISYEAGAQIVHLDDKWHYVDCPQCATNGDAVYKHHSRQITAQGFEATMQAAEYLARSA